MISVNHSRVGHYATIAMTLALTIAATACHKPTDTAPASPAPSTSVTPAMPADSPKTPAGPATPSQPAGPQASPTPFVTKHFDGVGVITKINNDLGSVELNHEAIKGLMPAMQMEYYVKDKAMLSSLKVGDKVDFTIEDTGGAEAISAIHPRSENKK